MAIKDWNVIWSYEDVLIWEDRLIVLLGIQLFSAFHLDFDFNNARVHIHKNRRSIIIKSIMMDIGYRLNLKLKTFYKDTDSSSLLWAIKNYSQLKLWSNQNCYLGLIIFLPYCVPLEWRHSKKIYDIRIGQAVQKVCMFLPFSSRVHLVLGINHQMWKVHGFLGC